MCFAGDGIYLEFRTAYRTLVQPEDFLFLFILYVLLFKIFIAQLASVYYRTGREGSNLNARTNNSRREGVGDGS